ncbi:MULTISPECIES: 30S ribosomal protein S24e [unclassified Methanoculleus]|jgi:small subunit ribosomal protein S24e|uniref:Small ribosomal subunit protein eS24 n=1 Tax=Methanoculleus palmolei TaxID=72612 RepID=A0ABD8A9G1_9EURY|nr:30S ribosomal protein S24e [Methanoculleus sp. UBA377]MDD2472764.1 30S ribosomal protein S24e [Methanoculleus sp.]WOX56163.1 30S ribosomal protein S24e [Methanoculleus palmolei]
MDFEITRDQKNELLNRRELSFTLTFDGSTPSRKSIREKLAAMLNTDENLLVLDLERTRYGVMELCGRARIYDDEESKNSTERAYLLKRGEPKPESEEA